jgi:hypothetical protein
MMRLLPRDAFRPNAEMLSRKANGWLGVDWHHRLTPEQRFPRCLNGILGIPRNWEFAASPDFSETRAAHTRPASVPSSSDERGLSVSLFPNVMLAGTVEMMFERTRDAAVATAASPDALAEKRLLSRYGR